MDIMVLGVGDLGVTKKPGSRIKTYALGSCVALLVYDVRLKVAGMAHIALPNSSIHKERAVTKPGYFADTAVKTLLSSMIRLRGPSGKGLVVKMAGGSNIMDAEGTFAIGIRNVQAVRELLTRVGLHPSAQDVGGQISRTVTLETDTGKVLLSSPGRPDWEL